MQYILSICDSLGSSPNTTKNLINMGKDTHLHSYPVLKEVNDV